MNSRLATRRTSSTVAVMVFILLQSVTYGQQNPMLEQRIRNLEQRVSDLELRMYAAFGGKQNEVQRARFNLMNQMNAIAGQAYQYRLRPTSLNGGGGSYVGFILPQRMALTDAGMYSITVSDTQIVIDARSASQAVSGTIRGKCGSSGRIGSWEYDGDFKDTNRPVVGTQINVGRSKEVMISEISNIASNAYQYRIRPASMAGGAGSYVGYSLPSQMARTNVGIYETKSTANDIVVDARSVTTNGTMRASVDRDGRVVGWAFGGDFMETDAALPIKPKVGVDKTVDVVVSDMNNIAARAYEYRNRPANVGGGGGKYIGYLSAQTMSSDNSSRLDLQVEAEWVIITATMIKGDGTMSAKVDARGKLDEWKITGSFNK